MKIGITGGIGSGKSYVCKLLELHYGIKVYDCDTAAKRIMLTDNHVRQQLTSLIGHDCYDSDGRPDKAVIASFLLASEQNNQAINSIVHPAVIHDFQTSGFDWMESAILYESGIDSILDYVVVVTAPEEVRLQRICLRDSISRQKAMEWIARQWPQEQLRNKASFEIVNDGTSPLIPQIDKLLKTLNKQ